MLHFLLWYLSVSITGWLVFPAAFRLLPGLRDRGYTLSRTLGWLAWGYTFWLLASLSLVRNDTGGLLLAFGVVLALGLWALRGISTEELSAWWRERRGFVLGVEALFLLSFAGLAFVRAANPEIAGTEKPMELAFINAILKSPAFPPHDPWLSGYAISYYHFGFVLVALLARLTATPGSVAFNLGVSLVFALSALGSYGLVYNLLGAATGRGEASTGRSGRFAALGGLFGPLFVLLAGNLEGFLDVLHAGGIFWRREASGQLVSAFWKWLDIRELNQPPPEPFSWLPTRINWWWRASRVVQDYDLSGGWREIIDEFPFFSYLLADLHPHVLAMPFAFLTMGMALNLFLGGAGGRFRWLGLDLRLSAPAFAAAALVLGGLAFLNTWDFPIYLILLCGAYALAGLRRARPANPPEGEDRPILRPVPAGELPPAEPANAAAPAGGSAAAFAAPAEALAELPAPERPSLRAAAKDFLSLGLALGISGIVLYLPFYLGFSSQAGGPLPNLVYATRGAHLWVMFGSFLLPLAVYLLHSLKRSVSLAGWLRAGALVLGAVFLLWASSLVLGYGLANLPMLGDLYLGTMGARGRQDVLLEAAVIRRLASPGGWLTLAIVAASTLALLARAFSDGRTQAAGKQEGTAAPPRAPAALSPADFFASWLILLGALLALAPEFYYLRDQFGWRMNTIFKFYYQAWLLWGAAAAFGTAGLLRRLRGWRGTAFTLLLIGVLGMALVYPILGLWTKTNGFDPPSGFTLDGAAFLRRQDPDERDAIEWLRGAPLGVVLEAVGDSYSEYGRVATFSGQPTVLGWPGHESQWRGGGDEIGSRQSDVERIYQTRDWQEARPLLERYGVRYVFIGTLERATYRVNEAKFQRFLTPIFRQGEVTIYGVP